MSLTIPGRGQGGCVATSNVSLGSDINNCSSKKHHFKLSDNSTSIKKLPENSAIRLFCRNHTSTKPVVLVDLDYLYLNQNENWSQVLELLKKIKKESDVDIITMSLEYCQLFQEDNFKNLHRELRSLDIVLKPYQIYTEVFNAHETGFDEMQRENLKRLKFRDGLPIVAVLSRPSEYAHTYSALGVDFLKDDSAFVEFRETFREKLAEHQKLLEEDPEKYYWDGLTESEVTYGNQFKFITDNDEAAQKVLDIVNKSESFIHITNLVFYNDIFGKKLIEALILKSKAGINVRIILDEMASKYIPLPSDSGFLWLEDKYIQKMEDAGIEIVWHKNYEYPDQHQPMWGVFTRHHWKAILADSSEGLVYFGGGRIIADTSFTNIRSEELGLLGMGTGPFFDTNLVSYGPLNLKVQERFINKFRKYGGELSISEVNRLISPELVSADRDKGTKARYIAHDVYKDQNTHNVLLSFLEDPHSETITFVNSFHFSEEIVEAMKKAPQRRTSDGQRKKVRLFIGSLYPNFDLSRNKYFKELSDAGVEIYLFPYKMHTKIYFTEDVLAIGSHNLDPESLRNNEDLVLIPRGSDEIENFLNYLENLSKEAVLYEDVLKDSEMTIEKATTNKLGQTEDVYDEDKWKHNLLFGLYVLGSGLVVNGLKSEYAVYKRLLSGRESPDLNLELMPLELSLRTSLFFGPPPADLFDSDTAREVSLMDMTKRAERSLTITPNGIAASFYDRNSLRRPVENFLGNGNFASRSGFLFYAPFDFEADFGGLAELGLEYCQSFSNSNVAGCLINHNSFNFGGRFSQNTYYSMDRVSPANRNYLSFELPMKFDTLSSNLNVRPYYHWGYLSDDQRFGLAFDIEMNTTYPRRKLGSIKFDLNKDLADGNTELFFSLSKSL